MILERVGEIAEMTPTSVTQGRTLNDGYGGYAVDKDLSTVAKTYTDDGAGWINLKFDKTYFIHKVHVLH